MGELWAGTIMRWVPGWEGQEESRGGGPVGRSIAEGPWALKPASGQAPPSSAAMGAPHSARDGAGVGMGVASLSCGATSPLPWPHMELLPKIPTTALVPQACGWCFHLKECGTHL